MEEIELKYRLEGPADPQRLREKLRQLGARRLAAQREQDALFDTPAGDLAAGDSVLRLRVVDDERGGTLAYKGPARFSGAVKARQELQVEAADAAAARELLAALGYQPTLSYAKQRELWRLGEVEVALDELEMGHFCELEGPEADITELARQLGLEAEQAELATYPDLIVRHRDRGAPPA